jgi:hypothetical protein
MMLIAPRKQLLTPELLFTIGFLLLLTAGSFALDLPISAPTIGSAEFVGVHYLFPLLGIGVWGAFAMRGQRGSLSSKLLKRYVVDWLLHAEKLWRVRSRFDRQERQPT